jgi:DNA-directed RNA polymerase specialized sigma24 family protein
MIDPRDPTLTAQLGRRTPEGRYEITEIEVVKAIRVFHEQGDMETTQMLSEVLVERCGPEFQRHSWGLRHRPELREEAIANMSEHLLREALNPKEIFMTQNFIHYVRCLCVDEFNRILRQEGLRYQRDEEGRPTGRPHHIPRALMEPLQATPVDGEAPPTADVADPLDQYEHMHANEESQRILTFLADPLDRKIVTLRALEGMKWDDIAEVCKRTERTIRLRYEKARVYLRECLATEQSARFRAAQLQ